MMNPEQFRQQAVALRGQGLSRQQIADRLGVIPGRRLDEALKGTAAPEWTARPRAKDDKRELARQLWREGLKYRQIAAELDVSLSSVSLWTRDLPAPPRLTGEYADERNLAMWRKRWEPVLQQREVDRQLRKSEAAASLGDIEDRDVLIAGAVLYWAEGAKSKTYRRQERLTFINSDALLIKLFLRYVRLLGAADADLTFRPSIHETADVTAATAHWAEVVGIPITRFAKPAIKRHCPKTNRRNLLDHYHGCLIIDVRRSAQLYQRTEGLLIGTVRGATGGPMG